MNEPVVCACPQGKAIPLLTSLDKPLPADFIEHAAGCNECLFWLSHVLAARMAFFTTNRVKNSAGCPPRGEFLFLLTLAAKILRGKPPQIGKKIAKNFFHFLLEPDELEAISPLLEHKQFCEFCGDYFNALYDEMTSAQEIYESKIKNREELRPVVADAAEEIDAESFIVNILPAGKPGRPN